MLFRSRARAAAAGVVPALRRRLALDVEPPASGQFSAEIRIRPQHALLTHPLQLGLLKRL